MSKKTLMEVLLENQDKVNDFISDCGCFSYDKCEQTSNGTVIIYVVNTNICKTIVECAPLCKGWKKTVITKEEYLEAKKTLSDLQDSLNYTWRVSTVNFPADGEKPKIESHMPGGPWKVARKACIDGFNNDLRAMLSNECEEAYAKVKDPEAKEVKLASTLLDGITYTSNETMIDKIASDLKAGVEEVIGFCSDRETADFVAAQLKEFKSAADKLLCKLKRCARMHGAVEKLKPNIVKAESVKVTAKTGIALKTPPVEIMLDRKQTQVKQFDRVFCCGDEYIVNGSSAGECYAKATRADIFNLDYPIKRDILIGKHVNVGEPIKLNGVNYFAISVRSEPYEASVAECVREDIFLAKYKRWRKMNYKKLSHDEIDEKIASITHERDASMAVMNEANDELIKLFDAKLGKITELLGS